MRGSLLGWLSLVVLSAAISARADEIRVMGGKKPITGVDVTDETLKEVKYKIANVRQAQSYNADEVVEVIYSDVPEDYTIAQENFERGFFEAAASLFKAAAADARRAKGLEAKCTYLSAESLRLAGRAKDAISAFDDMIAKYGDSRYLPHAVLGRARTLLDSGDDGRARKGFEKLKTYGGRWDYEAQLNLLVLDESKDPNGAFDAYKRLLSQTERTFPSVANQAKLRIGRALIQGGKHDEARKYFEKILEERDSSSRDIVAGAYNGLGASLWSKPGASVDDFRSALFSHLRVYVSYSDVLSEQPEALYSIGKCFQKMPGADSGNRASQFLRMCAARYPDTKWAQKAMSG